MPNYFYYFTVYDTDGSVLTSGKYEINTEDEYGGLAEPVMVVTTKN